MAPVVVLIELLEIGLALARWLDVGKLAHALVVAGSDEDELAALLQVSVEHWVWDAWEVKAAPLDEGEYLLPLNKGLA